MRGEGRSIESWGIDLETEAIKRPVWRGTPVRSWAQFQKLVRRPERSLLARLDDYADSILVAGCQRSGTTAVTRLLKQVHEIADYGFGPDDELDGALLLAGYVDPLADGRHCFQTTYLNERFGEYFEHDEFRLVWILRDPQSVVYSMLHNWKRAALNRLFDGCERPNGDANRARGRGVVEWIGPSRLDKACASYVSKTAQTFMLHERLGERMLIVDYDDLIFRREILVPEIFRFVDLPFDPGLLSFLHRRSARKQIRLPEWKRDHIESVCAPVYCDARALRTIS
jgi:hypothetical protein